MKKIKLALIGKNISHSKSQMMYEDLLGRKIDYTLIDCQHSKDIPTISELREQYMGVSITSPYKEHFLKELILEPEQLIAINCLNFKADKTIGTNTDYLAVIEIVNRYVEKKGIRHFGIIGDGVMGKITKLALESLRLEATIFSRSLGNLNEIESFTSIKPEQTLLINCCSREYKFTPIKVKNYYFWDMNYNLDHHRELFKEIDAEYEDGLDLLKNQAKYALKVWNLN